MHPSCRKQSVDRVGEGGCSGSMFLLVCSHGHQRVLGNFTGQPGELLLAPIILLFPTQNPYTHCMLRKKSLLSKTKYNIKETKTRPILNQYNKERDKKWEKMANEICIEETMAFEQRNSVIIVSFIKELLMKNFEK